MKPLALPTHEAVVSIETRCFGLSSALGVVSPQPARITRFYISLVLRVGHHGWLRCIDLLPAHWSWYEQREVQRQRSVGRGPISWRLGVLA